MSVSPLFLTKLISNQYQSSPHPALSCSGSRIKSTPIRIYYLYNYNFNF